MTALFEVSSDPELIAEHGRTQFVDVMSVEDGPAGARDHDMISHVTWPRFSVLVDISRRTAEVRIMGQAFRYVDLAGRERITLLRAERPSTLHVTEQILEHVSKRPSAGDADGVVEGRGMRDSGWPPRQGIAWIRIEEAAGLSPAGRGTVAGAGYGSIVSCAQISVKTGPEIPLGDGPAYTRTDGSIARRERPSAQGFAPAGPAEP